MLNFEGCTCMPWMKGSTEVVCLFVCLSREDSTVIKRVWLSIFKNLIKCRRHFKWLLCELYSFYSSHLYFQQEQNLWAVDLNLWYDDSVAMTQLMLYVTSGTLDTKNYVFNVPPPKKEKKKSTHRRKFEYIEPEVRAKKALLNLTVHDACHIAL